MTDLELFVAIFFVCNGIVTITLTMILDNRITKLETRLRNKYVPTRSHWTER